MNDRRGTYFAFQGLLTAVLLALFLRGYPDANDWLSKFPIILVVLAAPIIFVRAAPRRALSFWWVQAGLFLIDAGIATMVLIWTGVTDLYLVYFLIIFGTALTRNIAQSVVVALVTSILFLVSAWRPNTGLPKDSEFWLKFMFLWVVSALLAILSRDSRQAESDQALHYQEKLIQAERLAALGQVSGEVAHRIKAPLTTILVNAEVLSHRFKDPGARRELTEIQAEALRCREILKDLLDLGRLEELEFRRMDLRDAARAALKCVAAQAENSNIRLFARGLERPLMMRGDESLLGEAIAAVLQNALDASISGASVALKIAPARSQRWWAKVGRPDCYAVTIEDHGKGIRPEDLDRIFKPFFTTKGPNGTGLGLSAALRILQKHHGTIEAYSEGPGQGALFTITVPKAPPQQEA